MEHNQLYTAEWCVVVAIIHFNSITLCWHQNKLSNYCTSLVLTHHSFSTAYSSKVLYTLLTPPSYPNLISSPYMLCHTQFSSTSMQCQHSYNPRKSLLTNSSIVTSSTKLSGNTPTLPLSSPRHHPRSSRSLHSTVIRSPSWSSSSSSCSAEYGNITRAISLTVDKFAIIWEGWKPIVMTIANIIHWQTILLYQW